MSRGQPNCPQCWLVSDLKGNIFFTLTIAQEGVKTNIGKSGSFIDLELFRIQLTQRLDNMHHLDLIITRESRGTQSTICTILGKTFGKEPVLTALV